jgi:hypothetical protein
MMPQAGSWAAQNALQVWLIQISKQEKRKKAKDLVATRYPEEKKANGRDKVPLCLLQNICDEGLQELSIHGVNIQIN